MVRGWVRSSSKRNKVVKRNLECPGMGFVVVNTVARESLTDKLEGDGK